MDSRVNYHEYIQSAGWNAKRLAALRRAAFRCQLCGGNRPLDVHHNTYKRLGHERDSDLIALCESCHKTFHKPPIPKFDIRDIPKQLRKHAQKLNMVEQSVMLTASERLRRQKTADRWQHSPKAMKNRIKKHKVNQWADNPGKSRQNYKDRQQQAAVEKPDDTRLMAWYGLDTQ